MHPTERQYDVIFVYNNIVSDILSMKKSECKKSPEFMSFIGPQNKRTFRMNRVETIARVWVIVYESRELTNSILGK